MRRYILLYITAACITFLPGCDRKEAGPFTGAPGDEILLSSSSEQLGRGMSRAATDFPNEGSIGLVAATSFNIANPALTDWSQYPDIFNAKATAVSKDNAGVYGFQWVEKKYWPFDGSNLYFMAYSPAMSGALDGLLLSTMGDGISIALTPNIPDVMYASSNTNPQPYNKNSGTVDLGEFHHAMSQLTVRVEAGAGMPASVVVTSLTVSTTARSGSLYLPQGDDGLSVAYSDDNPYTATLVDGQTGFQNGVVSNTTLLFPGTEDVTSISLTLLDTNTQDAFSGTYGISFFESDVPNQPIRLQRAKNTELRMIVQFSGVQEPRMDLKLKGQLTDWIDGGRYGVGIQ